MIERQSRIGRIVQVVPSYSGGDAVGNEVTAMDKALQSAGYKTCIYAANIGKHIDEKRVRHLSDLPDLFPEDILIYHMCIACDFVYQLSRLSCRKVMVYHNVTPPKFFRKYDIKSACICEKGLEEVRYLAGKIDFCIADSEWNKRDLIDMGYDCPIEVMPVMIPFEDFAKPCNIDVVDSFGGRSGANILFTGRVAPNKCHHDLIEAFYYFKRDYDSNARLFLVGGYDPLDMYYLSLRSYIKALGVKDVYFSGHIPFDSILAYYQIADVFLCQSEHEGFCVPLVEAMLFNKPIVAYGCTAINDTVGEGGIVLSTKEPMLTAGVLNRVLEDEALSARIVDAQKRRLSEYSFETLRFRFLTLVKQISEGLDANDER